MFPTRNLQLSVGLTDEHLRAIGLVAVRWAEFESTLSQIIWDIAKLKIPAAYVITAHLNERARADMCMSLADAAFGKHPLSKKLSKHLLHIIKNIYPERSKFVHSTWGASHLRGKSEILPIKARKKLEIGPRGHYSADDINATAQKIYDAHLYLCQIQQEIKELLPTLPGWKQRS